MATAPGWEGRARAVIRESGDLHAPAVPGKPFERREDVVEELIGPLGPALLTLVLGGARSGKSEAAEALAARLDSPVTYVAAGGALAGDEAWAARVERHRRRRPAAWETIELAPGGPLAEVIGEVRGGVLLDAVGPWLAGCDPFDAAEAPLLAALAARRAWTVVVSDEVGMGVHPPSAAGVAFADALGSLNRAIGLLATSAYLAVAGRLVALGPPVTQARP